MLRNFPVLRFKKFIDSSKEKDKIKEFLCIQAEVVVTNVKICTCQEYFSHEAIKCKVIRIRNKSSSLRGYEKREENCEK